MKKAKALAPEQEHGQEHGQKQARLLHCRWEVAFKDRGMGHGDFGVMTETGELVVECPSRDIAGHIVSIHNAYRDSQT